MSLRLLIGALLVFVGHSARIRDGNRAIVRNASKPQIVGSKVLSRSSTGPYKSEEGIQMETNRHQALTDLPTSLIGACATWHAVVAVTVVFMLTFKWRADGDLFLEKDEKRETATETSGESSTASSSPWDFAILKFVVFTTCFFTTMNCTAFMPGSTSVAEKAGGGIFLSGLLLGAYGIGGIFGTFIARTLTHISVQASFLFVCICMFVGNGVPLLCMVFPEQELPWDVILFFGRACAGMELGIEYTIQALILNTLNPTKDENIGVALFSYTRLFQYSGAALGPAASALMSQLGAMCNLNEAMATLVFFCVFALAFAGVICCFFPRVELPIKAQLDAIAHYDPEAVAPSRRAKAWANFIAYNLVTFLRHGMRIAVEAGSLLVFAQTFKFSPGWAACLTSGVMMVSIPGNFFLGLLIERGKLSHMVLAQILEGVQILGSFGLFSFAGGGHLGVGLFIFGSGIFYGVNATLSNLLQGQYFEVAILGHPILSSYSLVIVNTIAQQLGMAWGPIASRALNACSGIGQDTLAFLVLSNLVWQYVCTHVLMAR